MAFAAVALASCSSDDKFGAENGVQTTIGENEVFAYIAGDTNDDATRAGYATWYNNENGKIRQQAVFSQGDVFKMYRVDTWKPQLLKFKSEAVIEGINGGIFEWANFTNDDAKYNYGVTDDESTNYGANDMTGREYAVYPADMFKFTDEKRGTLEFTLPASNDLNNLNGYYVGAASEIKEGYTVYNSLIPMFGFYMGEGEGKGLRFKYMTSMVRVYLQGLSSGEHTLTLFTADAEKSNKLNGTFTATQFDAADYEAGDDALPVFNSEKLTTGCAATLAAATGTEPNLLKFTFQTNELESDFVIFLPIPTGEYTLNALKLYLDGTEDDNLIPMTLANTYASGANAGQYIPLSDCTSTTATDANAAVQKLDRGIKLLAEKKTAIKANVSSLWEINTLLAQYATYGRDIEAEITLNADIQVMNENASGYTTAMKRLTVPTLQNNVKLVLKKAAAGSQKITGRVLNIVDEGEVTNKKKFTLELQGVTATEGINYTSKQNFELIGNNDAILGTADTKPVTINTDADVTLNATAIKNLVVTAAKTLTVAADPSVAFTTAVPTTVTAGIANAVTASNDITVDTETGTIATLNLTGANKTVTINKGTVNNLVIGTPAIVDPETPANGITASVVMTGGTIAALKGTGTAADEDKFLDNTHITVTTSGAASITAVKDLKTTNDATKASISFTSTYTAEAGATAATPVEEVIPIYTAGQLAAVVTGKAYKLMTDVTIPADKAWESKDITKSFDGNNKTIKGLNAPLFGTISAVLTVENLKLVDPAIATVNSEVDGLGALAKNVTAGATLSKIGVTGAVLGAAAGKATENSNNIGGLVGFYKPTSEATLTIKDCYVTGTIQGYYNMGGFIGLVDGTTAAPTVIINNTAALATKSAVTFAKSLEINTTRNQKYGRVGTFIGSLAGTTAATVTIGGNADYNKTYAQFATSSIDAAALTFERNNWDATVSEKEGVYTYKGMIWSANEIGYSATAPASLTLYNATKFAADYTQVNPKIAKDAQYKANVNTANFVANE